MKVPQNCRGLFIHVLVKNHLCDVTLSSFQVGAAGGTIGWLFWNEFFYAGPKSHAGADEKLIM